jgi:pyrroloquinoline quinone biosynthesis protein B
LRIIVLGAAAGGGFPQWNSHAGACRRARAGDPAARPATQTSIAVSGDDRHWFILNAAPDLREQINRTPWLHPNSGLRSTPITGVLLTCGEVDALAGLLNLREGQPFTLYGTAQTHAVIAASPIFDVLARGVVERRTLGLDEQVSLAGGLQVQLFAVPGKVPLYLEDQANTSDGDVVGIAVTQKDMTLCFVPGCAAMTPGLAARLHGSDIVMFDGTLWRDDEMIAAGLGRKTGRRMGHMSISGADGVIAAFAGLDVQRKILIHLNNSNPVLLDEAPERAAVRAAGWDVAYDGMEILL